MVTTARYVAIPLLIALVFISKTGNGQQVIDSSIATSDSILVAQTVDLNNASFEGISRRGVISHSIVEHWKDVGSMRYKGTSSVDIRSAESDYWHTGSIQPYEGETYLGFAVRSDGSFEAISQKLNYPLVAGYNYRFTVYLRHSKKFKSHKLDSPYLVDFITPAVFRIQGINHSTEKFELLAVSTPIDHEEWKAHTFVLSPKDDVHYLVLEAYFDRKAVYGYDGNLFLDAASPIILLDKKVSEIDSTLNKGKRYHIDYVDLNATESLSKATLTNTEVPPQEQLEILAHYYKWARELGINECLAYRDKAYIQNLIEYYQINKLNAEYLVDYLKHDNTTTTVRPTISKENLTDLYYFLTFFKALKK